MEKELANRNEDLNDIIKIAKPVEDSNLLIDGITETVKHEIKQEGGIIANLLAPSPTSLVQLVISAVVKGISERGIRRIGKRYMDKCFFSVPSFKH